MLNIETAVPLAVATRRPSGENVAEVTGTPSEAMAAAASLRSPGVKMRNVWSPAATARYRPSGLHESWRTGASGPEYDATRECSAKFQSLREASSPDCLRGTELA